MHTDISPAADGARVGPRVNFGVLVWKMECCYSCFPFDVWFPVCCFGYPMIVSDLSSFLVSIVVLGGVVVIIIVVA